MAKLIINPNSIARREVELPRSLLCIGRDPSNDLVLPDAMVSRHHAVVERRSNRYFLRDCNSSNGSLVNGDRVSERSLQDGDLVAIGTARLLFREDPVVAEPGAKVVPHPSVPRLNCPECEAVYRKGDVFCRSCGARLEPSIQPKLVCTSCGTVVSLPASFCNACGQALVQPGSELEVTKPQPALADEPEGGSEHAEAEGAAGAELEAPGHNTAPAPDREQPARVAMHGAASALGAGPRPVIAEPPSAARGPRPFPAAGLPSHKRPTLRAPQVKPPPAGFEPAPLDRRLAAGIIDIGLVALAQLALVAPAGLYWWSRELPSKLTEVLPSILLSLSLFGLAIGLGAVYFVYFWGVRGATPGKRLLGIAVESVDGSYPIGVSQACMRLLGYVLSGALLGIGFLMIAFGATALHDRVAGTRVIRRNGV